MPYIKPGPNFKINKQTKRSIARYIDPHERGEQKRIMIQAQLQGETYVKREKRKPGLEDSSES